MVATVSGISCISLSGWYWCGWRGSPTSKVMAIKFLLVLESGLSGETAYLTPYKDAILKTVA